MWTCIVVWARLRQGDLTCYSVWARLTWLVRLRELVPTDVWARVLGGVHLPYSGLKRLILVRTCLAVLGERHLWRPVIKWWQLRLLWGRLLLMAAID